jgi:hypothetical protein
MNRYSSIVSHADLFATILATMIMLTLTLTTIIEAWRSRVLAKLPSTAPVSKTSIIFQNLQADAFIKKCGALCWAGGLP